MKTGRAGETIEAEIAHLELLLRGVNRVTTASEWRQTAVASVESVMFHFILLLLTSLLLIY